MNRRSLVFNAILIYCLSFLCLHNKAYGFGNNQYYNSLQYQGYRQRQELMDMELPLSNDISVNQGEKFKPQIKGCVKINNIDIENPYSLSKEKIDHIIKKWNHRCLTVSDINTILNILNQAYLKTNFLTTRAYLPQQDLSSGHLRIVIIEGRIENFNFTGTPERFHEMTAFPWIAGNVLDLNDLKQGLDNMNRLPNWKTSLKINKGHQDNTSIVEVKTPKAGLIHGKVSTDNNGQSISARTIGRSNFIVTDLFGVLDMWSFEYDHSLNNRQRLGHNSFFSMEGSVPMGPWLLWCGWWRSDDMYHDGPKIALHREDVTQKDFHVGISRVLTRDLIGVTSLIISYQTKSFMNYRNHIRENYKSARLSMLNITLSEYTKLWDRVWYINLGTKIGLNGLMTKTWINNSGKYAPHTRFVKFILDIQGDQPIIKSLTWHTFVHGEYSDKSQYDNEQMQIGGPYTVRGFIRQNLAGNAGVYIRNDLSWTLPTDDMHCGDYQAFCDFFLDKSELYGSLDAGMTRAVYATPYHVDKPKVGNIGSGGIGLRKKDGIFMWDASVTHAFTPSILAPEGWIAGFAFGISL